MSSNLSDPISTPGEVVIWFVALVITSWIAIDTRRALWLSKWAVKGYTHSDRYILVMRLLAAFIAISVGFQLVVHLIVH
jgi:hypothetical protein